MLTKRAKKMFGKTFWKVREFTASESLEAAKEANGFDLFIIIV